MNTPIKKHNSVTSAKSDELTKLRITEIFYSLQGESTTVGLPTIFIRLTGCPLRCLYCDTAYAFTGGEFMELTDIFEQLKLHSTEYITVTGGEPLAQRNCIKLLTALCDAGYKVSLETSGAMDITEVDPRVMKVLDIKTPGSVEVSRNLWTNIDLLTEQDQIKFVICDRADYEWSRAKLTELKLNQRCQVLFSPSYGQLPKSSLANWVLEDQLPVRFQLQLHKVLWGDEPGR